MACYIYFSRKGQMVAKLNNIGVQCSRNVGVRRSIIEICRSSIVKIDRCSTVVGIWQFISNPFLLACSMLFASTLLPVCFLLPVVYFVVEIASMCWWLIITCLFPTKQTSSWAQDNVQHFYNTITSWFHVFEGNFLANKPVWAKIYQVSAYWLQTEVVPRIYISTINNYSAWWLS